MPKDPCDSIQVVNIGRDHKLAEHYCEGLAPFTREHITLHKSTSRHELHADSCHPVSTRDELFLRIAPTVFRNLLNFEMSHQNPLDGITWRTSWAIGILVVLGFIEETSENAGTSTPNL